MKTNSGIVLNLMVEERQKTPKWMEGMTHNYSRINVNGLSKTQDIICWNYYNNILPTNRFDYFLKVGQNYLPAQPRHIPLQRPLIDLLVSQQLYRPFVFSVVATDRSSVNDRVSTMLKALVHDLGKIIRTQFFGTKNSIEAIQQQMSQLMQFIQQEPQTPEQAQQIEQLKVMLPAIKTQAEASIDTLEDELLITREQLEELKHYYRYNYHDYKEELAQKVALHLRNELNIKNTSKEVFLQKVVTGKPYYFVDYIDGERYPRFEKLESLKVVFPKIGNVSKIQDGPWVKLIERLSFNQVIMEFGEALEIKYGRKVLEDLAEKSGAFQGAEESTYYPTPNGDTLEQVKYNPSVYSGVYEDSSGIKVERVYFKCPRKISIKYSPNPYQEGEFFKHFIEMYKIPINEDQYNYRNGMFVKKDDDQMTFRKDDVETYSERRGQSIKTRYVTDVYEGIVIADQFLVRCRKKKVIRHPDKKSQVWLPVFGPTFAERSSQPYSIIWNTKDIQELYDFIHTQRELMLALAGTKTIFYDRSQKPGDIGDDEFHYQRKRGIVYVQTVDANGNTVRTPFNQWTAVDLSVSPSVQYFDAMLNNLEDLMGNMVGIPRARKGQVINTDQVGTFKESINRAQLITEILYFDHDQVEAEALTHLLNLALNFSFPDGSEFELFEKDFGRDVVRIPPGIFKDAFFEVKVFNQSEEAKKMEDLRELLGIGWQQGVIDFPTLVNTYGVDTVAALQKKVEYFSQRARELHAKEIQQEHANDMELVRAKVQFANEFNSYWKQMELKIKEMKLELDKELGEAEIALKQRDQALEEKGIDLDATLKSLELQNEKLSEDNVLALNDKHQSKMEELQGIRAKLDYMIKMLQLNQAKVGKAGDMLIGMEKNRIDEKKARQQVKEHVSDR